MTYLIRFAACIGGLCLLFGGYWVAGAQYETHAPISSDTVLRQTNLALLLVGSGETDRAIALVRQATDNAPEEARPYYTLGILLERKNMQPEAILAYRQAIRFKPDWVDPHMNLGILLGRSGQLEEAAEQFRAAGDHPDARHNLEITERALQQRQLQRAPPR